MKSKRGGESVLSAFHARQKSIDESSLQMRKITHAANDDALHVNRSHVLTEKRSCLRTVMISESE